MVCKILHGDSQGNTQMLRVSERAIAVNLELTWQHLLSEFHPKQTSCSCKSISPFTMGLYGSHIHVAIIATSRLPLITTSDALLCAFIVGDLRYLSFW